VVQLEEKARSVAPQKLMSTALKSPSITAEPGILDRVAQGLHGQAGPPASRPRCRSGAQGIRIAIGESIAEAKTRTSNAFMLSMS
jgi:hypothetical protein